MSIITGLLGIKVPAIVYEILAGVLVAGILVAYGMNKERLIVKHEVQKQEVIVEHKVLVTDQSQEKELEELRQYRAAHPVTPDFGVCVAGDSGAAPAPQGPVSSPGGSVQQVPSGNSGVQPLREGRPIGGMLDALAGRADKVSAELRRRQELEP